MGTPDRPSRQPFPEPGEIGDISSHPFRTLSLQPIEWLYRARDPHAIALAGARESYSYDRLIAAVDALASAFQAIVAEPGSRVGICARNNREHLLALLATYAAGKVWVPLNPRNGRAELDTMLAATRPSLIVADEDCLERFTPTGAPVIRAGAIDGLVAEYMGQRPAPIARSAGDEQIIKFSGGSTGRPKAVVQSVRCLNAQASGILDAFAFDASDVNLIAAPLTHGTSCFVLPILAVGGRHVIAEEPRAPAILEAFASYAVTTVYLPPTIIYALLAEPGVAARPFPSLRHVIYSAAPMSAERIRQAQRVFGPVIETAYGQVEAPQIIAAMRADELMRDENLASVGRPSAVARVGIMDGQGRLLPPGDVGEIVVQGDLVMNGYLDQPELTAKTIVNGWLHTGDLGLLDDRGYLFIRGRLRETINTGGFKVLPAEVEAALGRHPAVAECSVFGVEDARWGEAVHAAVRFAPGASASEAELIQFVKNELDSVKAPKRIYVVRELPRNPAGKVSRAAVRSMVGAGEGDA